jgi:hypothetical protein
MKDAEAGDAVAQNHLGDLLFRGDGVTQDIKNAVGWWHKAAKQGNINAIANEAYCVKNGIEIQPDSLKAVALYERSVRLGNLELLDKMAKAAETEPFYALVVGDIFANGNGVSRDYYVSARYYELAAIQGSMDGVRNAGVSYLNAKRPEEAYKFFKFGADNDDLSCTYWCGKLLMEGKGVNKDVDEGVIMMMKAADAGFTNAQIAIGECYMNGEGVAKDSAIGIEWFKKAAAKEKPNALWNIAYAYLDGEGVESDYLTALYWMANASTVSHTRNLRNFLSDKNTKSNYPLFLDFSDALKLIGEGKYSEAVKAAKGFQKTRPDEYKLIEAFAQINPNNPKVNYKKGFETLDKLGEKIPMAYYIIAKNLENDAVKYGKATPLEYYLKASEGGFVPADAAIGDIYYEAQGKDRKLDEAVAHYKKALEANQLRGKSAKRYAQCVQEGYGGETPNKERANQIRGLASKDRWEDVLSTFYLNVK